MTVFQLSRAQGTVGVWTTDDVTWWWSVRDTEGNNVAVSSTRNLRNAKEIAFKKYVAHTGDTSMARATWVTP